MSETLSNTSVVQDKQNIIKSPLRYPGGKTRGVKVICDLIPPGVETLVSPFLGGGSVELACVAKGIKVYGYDVFKPLVAFWKLLLTQPDRLAAKVQEFYPLDKERFYQLQKLHQDEESEEQAILFFVLNRASFSGTTLSGGCSQASLTERFTQSAIDRLKSFKASGLTVEFADFKDTLDQHSHEFMYLDPPYLIKSTLYGNRGSTHRGFDHQGLYEKLKHRNGWILSYNNCEQVRELYKDFEIIFPDWKYGMSTEKSSKEVLILHL